MMDEYDYARENGHSEDVLPFKPDRPGLDVTSLDRAAAEKASRHCEHCHGGGFATIYDAEYAGSPVIKYFGHDGQEKSRVGRTVAYCVCAIGRWISVNHSKTSKSVFAIMPDFADIKGKSSFWLERDPTLRGEITNFDRLPQGLKNQLSRIAAREEQGS